MKINEVTDTLNPPSIDVGDEVKTGKFKNSKATVKGFKKDDHGQPVLKTNKGDKKLFSLRLSKLDETIADPYAATFSNKKKVQQKLDRQHRMAQIRIDKAARAGKQPSPKDMAFVYGGEEADWLRSQQK